MLVPPDDQVQKIPPAEANKDAMTRRPIRSLTGLSFRTIGRFEDISFMQRVPPE
jgi:hypothetical protein